MLKKLAMIFFKSVTIFSQIVTFQTKTIMPRKTRNLLDRKLKNALAKCCGELISLAPQLTSRQLEKKLSNTFDVGLQIIFC